MDSSCRTVGAVMGVRQNLLFCFHKPQNFPLKAHTGCKHPFRNVIFCAKESDRASCYYTREPRTWLPRFFFAVHLNVSVSLALLVAPTLLVLRLLPLSKDVFPLSTCHMVTSGSAMEPVFWWEPAVVQLVSSIPAGLKESANKGVWHTEANAWCCFFHYLVVVVFQYEVVWGKNYCQQSSKVATIA